MVKSSFSSQIPKSRTLIAGVDNILFDQRTFRVDAQDIVKICRFFSLGNLLDFQQERDVIVSHSNFFVYVRTDKDRYALKFYPHTARKIILQELAINRLLKNHHFATPRMHVSRQGIPFYPCLGKIAACYEFIAGTPAWQHIKDQKITHKLIESIYLLKQILITEDKRPETHQKSLLTTALHILHTMSLLKIPNHESKIIHSSLQQTIKTIKINSQSFKRQWLHNNTTLTNFILKKNTIYTLDLSHVVEDYTLSDLSVLVISCLFLKASQTTMNALIKNYFLKHKLTKDSFTPLNALLTIHLIQEFIKNAQRMHTLDTHALPTKSLKRYLFHLKARKDLIIVVLKKIIASSLFKL